jgi:hypothetical protein
VKTKPDPEDFIKKHSPTCNCAFCCDSVRKRLERALHDLSVLQAENGILKEKLRPKKRKRPQEDLV